MNVTEIEDFKYIRGDPRPLFFHFLLNYDNMSSYISSSRFDYKDVFRFQCIQGRTLLPPLISHQKTILGLLQDQNSKLILYPIILRGKLNCLQKNNKRHMNVVLYNKYTHEVERLDIRKYHLQGFSLKLLVKKIVTKLIPDFIQKYDPQAHLIPEIDVPIAFIKKMGFDNARDAYPPYLLAYIQFRNEHPMLTSSEVSSLIVRSMTKTQVSELWNNFVSYNKSFINKTCEVGYTVNPETSHCIKTSSKTMQQYLLDKPIPICDNNKVYNSLIGKCVQQDKLLDIDIMLNEVANVELHDNKSINMVHLDRNVSIAVDAMNFILKKYPNAVFLYPHKNIDQMTRSQMRILWTFEKDSKTRILRIPTTIVNEWKKAMRDTSKRYIIIFVRLMTLKGSKHANVLIFDKNKNELERFDSLGRDTAIGYNVAQFDEEIRDFIKKRTDIFNKPVKYFVPLDYCPKFPVFQSKEIDEIPMDSLRGNCAVWRLWYINIRLANPHLNRKQVVKLANKKLANIGELNKFIKGYQRYIITNIQPKK